MSAAAPEIIVLHGANGCGREMRPLVEALQPFGRAQAPDLVGHGGRPVPARPTLQAQAEDILAQLDAAGIGRAWLVGYSLGGMVALWLARHAPTRVAGACAIATKWVFDAPTIAHWTYLADPARLARPGNPRAGELERAHAPQDWREVTLANRRLFAALGERSPLDAADLAAIARPVMLVNANRDQVAPWPETLELGRLIPGARLTMFLGLAHPLFRVPVPAVGRAIGAWMREAGP